MSNTHSADETNYGVRVKFADGSYEPPDTEEIHWVSLKVAEKIATKAFNARSSVVNSPVVAIEIIDADYKVVREATFPTT